MRASCLKQFRKGDVPLLYLREAGLAEVQLIETEGWPNSPSVVGRRRSAANGKGKTLHFNAHMDHIHQDHVPPYVDGDRVVGRGAADLKCGLTAILELIRILKEAELPGDLLVSGHDLHEAPIGYGEGLRELLKRGYVGDAVIVAEGPKDEIYLNGKSNSVFEIELKWGGEAVHELNVADDMPNLVEIGADVVKALKALQGHVSERRDRLLGPESLFLGTSQAGDFYNRLPKSCRVVGTRRYPPETNRSDVERELRETVLSVTRDLPIEVRIDASKGDDGFRLSADEPLVKIIRAVQR